MVRRTSSSGYFITLEGPEGVGKSTQATLLKQALRDVGVDAILTREPGGTPEAEEIRDLLLQGDPEKWDVITECLLFYAARRQHYVSLIAPSIKQGKWVICDRFADSTMAYQGYIKGVDKTFLQALYAMTLGNYQPDLTIVFDLPLEMAKKRLVERGVQDRMSRIYDKEHRMLHGAFLDIASNNPRRCHILDANGDPRLVHRRIGMMIKEQLGVDIISDRLFDPGIPSEKK